MRTATEAFVFAESLCSGSVTDNYATCILNNMRFMPYTKDTNVSLVSNSTGIVSNIDLPAIAGKTYVDLKAVAISDLRARMLQKNDSGQIRFRCLDVFSQPLLPLIDLQDLGLEDKSLTGETGNLLTISNAIDLDTTTPTECTDGRVYYTGVPIVCLDGATDDVTRYYRIVYNIRSHIIYLNNVLNEIDTGLITIKSIIDNNGDYNKLLGLYNDLSSKQGYVSSIIDILVGLQTYSKTLSVGNAFIEIIIDAFIDSSSNLDLSCLSTIGDYIHENEDWTHFQYYTEILTISSDIYSLTTSRDYLISFYVTSLSVALLKVMPTDYNESNGTQKNEFEISLGLKYASEFYNAINTVFNKIQSYTIGTTSLRLDVEESRLESFYILYDRGFLGTFDSSTHSDIWTILQANISVYNTGLYDFDNYFDFEDIPTLEELNSFYSSRGNGTISAYNNLYSVMNSYLGLSVSNLTEIDLGASFKDAGKYYFANVAYAVGFGTISNIHQIQIDDNIYDTTAITKADGTIVDQVSQEGCTKYRFRQKLFSGVDNNANTQEVEMYIYPGTRNQPFCPTINKYHNMASCKYTGLFTKLLENADGSIESALFLYKGYEPLKGQIAELIKLGSADINSIDLSLPNIDLNSTDSFIKRQIVSLNTSSTLLMDDVITSKDLRYYLKSNLVGTVAPVEVNSPIQHQGLSVPTANNFPYLAIIEFVGLPIGSNIKVPTIKILTTAIDSQI